MAPAKQQQTDNDSEQQKEQNTESGNFFSKYGKIFLIVAVLLVQGGVAYGVINSYYDQIYAWADQFSTETSVYHTFENIIVNPANTDGERYLILSIVVELGSVDAADRLDKNSAKIIDKTNFLLTQRNARQLADLKERDRIKQELGIVINEILEEKAVRNLFFTKYVLQ